MFIRADTYSLRNIDQNRAVEKEDGLDAGTDTAGEEGTAGFDNGRGRDTNSGSWLAASNRNVDVDSSRVLKCSDSRKFCILREKGGVF